jgi:outer membrane receptor for ferrienterochelin and colicins
MGRTGCVVFFGVFFLFLPLLSLASTTEKDISAVSLDSLLATEVSTASKYVQTAREAPASVTVITSDDITRYGWKTLGQALNSVRGFYLTYDRNYEYVGVRGFGRPGDFNNRLLLLLNGHTLNDNFYGSAQFGTELGIDLDMVERIEVVRGPGSALYGTGAMFAVVNIITKRGKSLDGFRVSGETGSYGEYGGTLGFGKEFRPGTEVLLSVLWGQRRGDDLYYREYDNPATNYGVAEGLDRDKYYGFLATAKAGDFRLQGIFTSREKHIPTGSWGTTFNDSEHINLDERAFIEMGFEKELSPSRGLSLRAYYDRYHYKGSYPYGLLQRDTNDGQWMGGEARFRWDIVPSNRLILGAEYQSHRRAYYKLWDDSGTYFRGEFPYSTVSLYAQDEHQIYKNLSLTVGFRYDGYSTGENSLSPRLALLYHPLPETTLKFLYGEGFRAPNKYEEKYADPFSGYKPNPNLDSERIRSMEIVLEQRITRFLFGTLSLYRYEMRDLIDQEVDPADLLIQHRNVRKVETNGVETELNWKSDSGIEANLSYSYQKAQDGRSERTLTNSPNHLAKLRMVYPFLGYLYIAPELHYESARKTVYSTRTGPYFLINVNLSTIKLWDSVRLSFLVRNLLDRTYKLPGGLEHVQPAITQDGRLLSLKAEYWF